MDLYLVLQISKMSEKDSKRYEMPVLLFAHSNNNMYTRVWIYRQRKCIITYLYNFLKERYKRNKKIICYFIFLFLFSLCKYDLNCWRTCTISIFLIVEFQIGVSAFRLTCHSLGRIPHRPSSIVHRPSPLHCTSAHKQSSASR